MGLINIVLQINPSEHHSEERYVVSSVDENKDSHFTPVNYSKLSAADKTEYTNMKTFCDALLPSGINATAIIFQIDKSQHNSEERVVIRYIKKGERKTLIKTYSSMSAAEKTKYTNLKTQANAKIPA